MELARLTAAAAAGTCHLKWHVDELPASLAENGMTRRALRKFTTGANETMSIASNSSSCFGSSGLFFPRRRKTRIQFDMNKYCELNEDKLPTGISAVYNLEIERRAVNYQNREKGYLCDAENKISHQLVFTKKRVYQNSRQFG